MKYILSYNETTGQFRIEEVHYTLNSKPDDHLFKQIGGSDQLEKLRFFVRFVSCFMPMLSTITMFFSGFTFSRSFEHIKRVYESMDYTQGFPLQDRSPLPVLEERIFKEGEY